MIISILKTETNNYAKQNNSKVIFTHDDKFYNGGEL